MTNKIISRKGAKEQGLKRYYPGTPCLRGHIAQRETVSGFCIQCGVEKRERAAQATYERRIAEGKRAYRVLNRPSPDKESVEARKLAKEKGLKTFRIDTPCKVGHFADRYVITGNCVKCDAIKSKLQHEAACKLRGDEYRREVCRRSREWALNNPGRLRARRKKYAEENKERLRAQKREYYKNNKERIDARINEYYAKHPGRRTAHNRNKKARKRNAEGKHTIAEIRDLFKKQNGRCIYCATEITLERKQKNTYHADHIVSLFRGGSNWISNIQLLCEPCNLSKGTKDHFEFARQNGMLI